MIKGSLISRIFEAASIQRWNDHVRPVELTELDKQAHKMLIAYVLGRFQEQVHPVNWTRLIEGGFFELIQRIVLTDLKPPVFHYLMKKAGPSLNRYVISQVEGDLAGLKSLESGNPMIKEMENFLEDKWDGKTERRILNAAHYLATKWEFELVYHAYPKMYGIDETKKEIEDKIEDYFELVGVQKILLGGKSHHFIDLCSQLRFQKRWSRTPRIPQTSVLGHMLVVAVLVFLLTGKLVQKPCSRRIYNNFFSALLHDLPEVYTRDIISPIKRQVPGLDAVIEEYERRKIEEKVLPLLPESWQREFIYFLENQFENRIFQEGRARRVREIKEEFNRNDISPVDGEMVKVADELAAFWEAGLSLAHGIRSPNLTEAVSNLQEKYSGTENLSGLFTSECFDKMSR